MIWLLLLLICGCAVNGPSPVVADSWAATGRANVAVIVGTLDLDRPEDLDTFPDGSEDERGAVGAPSKPVITAYAPAWRPASREFLEWYHALPAGFWDDKSFTLTVVEDKEPDSGDVPLFVWETAQTSGWFGVESLIATYEQYPVKDAAPIVEGRRGNESQDPSLATKRRKRDHDLVGVVSTVPGAELLPMILGEETTVRRRASGETKLPLGYGASLVIPAETELSASSTGDVTIVTVVAGAPKVLLPVLRRLWPVSVQRMRLSGDTLTIELDGWKDLTIKVSDGN